MRLFIHHLKDTLRVEEADFKDPWEEKGLFITHVSAVSMTTVSPVYSDITKELKFLFSEMQIWKLKLPK